MTDWLTQQAGFSWQAPYLGHLLPPFTPTAPLSFHERLQQEEGQFSPSAHGLTPLGFNEPE